MNQPQRANIAQVAADAGVSTTTVSHALSGKRSVAAATKQRIQQSVERLGYRPNLVAKSLRNSRTHTVALLVADIVNPYYPALARAVGDALAPSGYMPFICNTDGDAEKERAFLHEVATRSVDGVIIQAMSLRQAEIRHIVGTGMPLVVLSSDAASACDAVVTDAASGIREAVNRLLASGRTDIAFVTGPEGSGPSPVRLAAFQTAMERAGASADERRILYTAFTRDGGVEAGTRILATAPIPQAVMCANDLIAIGLMDVARASGVRMPEDLAVVGFDNIDTADLITPRLTTVDNFPAEVGSAAVETLLARIRGGDDDPAFQTIVLPTRLVVRESA